MLQVALNILSMVLDVIFRGELSQERGGRGAVCRGLSRRQNGFGKNKGATSRDVGLSLCFPFGAILTSPSTF